MRSAQTALPGPVVRHFVLTGVTAALLSCSSSAEPNPTLAGGGRGGSAGGGGEAATTLGGSAGASAGGSGGSTALGGAAGTSGTAGAAGLAGTGGEAAGPVRHRVMAMEYPGRLVEISSEGAVVWEHQTPSLAVMFEVLPNGNVFFPHGAPSPGAQEVDRQHNVVWSYQSTAGELLGGQRLPNGNTLLGEGGPGKALELSPAKTVVRSINLPTSETDAHRQVRHLRRLENGNILAAFEGEGAAREFDEAGATVWEYGGALNIHAALRLPNGNTLIGGGESKRVLEVSSAGQVVWEFNDQDDPGLGLKWVTSLQALSSGNLLVGNWLGASGGEGAHAFEVTRDKQVVWRLEGDVVKSATCVYALDD